MPQLGEVPLRLPGPLETVDGFDAMMVFYCNVDLQ